MITKFLFGALAILSTSSCSDTSPRYQDAHSPYGIWVTERGHVIVITRDKRYTYCGKESCTQGAIELVGAFGVILKGFMLDPATKGLRSESGEDELNAVESKAVESKIVPDYDFTEKGSGMSDELRKSLCQDRPCVTIGNLEFNVYRFIKIDDF